MEKRPDPISTTFQVSSPDYEITLISMTDPQIARLKIVLLNTNQEFSVDLSERACKLIGGNLLEMGAQMEWDDDK
jgi:hypothetical protein